VWKGCNWFKLGSVASSRENGNELSCSTKGREFLDKLNDCQLVKKDSVPWCSYFVLRNPQFMLFPQDERGSFTLVMSLRKPINRTARDVKEGRPGSVNSGVSRWNNIRSTGKQREREREKEDHDLRKR
jgi:hypothetical protein